MRWPIRRCHPPGDGVAVVTDEIARRGDGVALSLASFQELGQMSPGRGSLWGSPVRSGSVS